MKKNESIIGQAMVITGEIECQGVLHLTGKIEGSLIGGDLVIEESGVLNGSVKGESIECSGHLEGNIITRSLVLKKSGCHVGTVETEQLEVEPGAILDCALQSGASRTRKTSTTNRTSTGLAKKTTQPSKPSLKAAQRTIQLNPSKFADAFHEDKRPCCFEVPWSERLELSHHLLGLLKKNKPLIKVMGEAGSGKSTFAAKLKKSLPENYFVMALNNRVGSVITLLQELALSLGLKDDGKNRSQPELFNLLKARLANLRTRGRRPVLIVDDTQEMYPATLEGIIRLLSNACSEESYGESGLMQIILLGTVEMKSKMVPTIHDYFEDETNCQLHLEPLNIKDTADYLRLGLQLCSGGGVDDAISLFPDETIKEIHTRSQGNMSKINALAMASLARAGKSGQSTVTPAHVLG